MGWIRERIKAEKRKHHDAPFGQVKRDLDWARLAEQKIINSIMEHCWSNNTIKFKNTNLRLAITDGGWVNCIELHDYLKGANKND